MQRVYEIGRKLGSILVLLSVLLPIFTVDSCNDSPIFAEPTEQTAPDETVDTNHWLTRLSGHHLLTMSEGVPVPTVESQSELPEDFEPVATSTFSAVYYVFLLALAGVVGFRSKLADHRSVYVRSSIGILAVAGLLVLFNLFFWAGFYDEFEVEELGIGFLTSLAGLYVFLLLPIVIRFGESRTDVTVANTEENEPDGSSLGHKLSIAFAVLVCIPIVGYTVWFGYVASAPPNNFTLTNWLFLLGCLSLPYFNWTMHKAVVRAEPGGRTSMLRGWALHQCLCLLAAAPTLWLTFGGF